MAHVKSGRNTLSDVSDRSILYGGCEMGDTFDSSTLGDAMRDLLDPRLRGGR